MKLLIFSPYYPPHVGGLESHADEFNKYLSRKGADITVFTPKLPVSAPETETMHNDVKIIRFPAFEIIPNYPVPKFWTHDFRRLFNRLFLENYDMVISRTRFFLTSLMALLYAKRKKIGWIHIEHGSDFVKSGGKISTFIAWAYDHIFGKLVLASADKILANSQASARFCKRLAPKKDCPIIYRGIEIGKIESAGLNLEMRNKYPDACIITFIGRLIDGKGIADLLHATKDMKEKFMIFIVGDGPQKKTLERIVRDLKMENKIIFFGHQKFEDAMALLKISDILVNPSYTEGLPTTVTEAALCKKAIVATNVGGTPEIITGNNDGFLVEAKNIGMLKEKLEILIRNRTLREEFGNNAYDKVKEKFDWNNSINKYLNIFNGLTK